MSWAFLVYIISSGPKLSSICLARSLNYMLLLFPFGTEIVLSPNVFFLLPPRTYAFTTRGLNIIITPKEPLLQLLSFNPWLMDEHPVSICFNSSTFSLHVSCAPFSFNVTRTSSSLLSRNPLLFWINSYIVLHCASYPCHYPHCGKRHLGKFPFAIITKVGGS